MTSSEQGLHHNLVQYWIHFIYHFVHCQYKKAIANCRNVGRLGVNCYMLYNLGLFGLTTSWQSKQIIWEIKGWKSCKFVTKG